MKFIIKNPSKCKLGKKGMGVGQVFIFIMAALTFSLIMIFGYKAINSFIKSGEQVEFVQFKTNLESSVQRISTEYGSVRMEKFRVPSKYTQVCFVNMDYSKDSKDSVIKEKDELCKKDQVACTVWEDALIFNSKKSGTGYSSVDDNVFLTPSAEVKLKVGRLSMLQEDGGAVGYLCFDVINGVFSVVLEGKGDHTELSKFKK